MKLSPRRNAKKNPSENDDTEKHSASCFSFVHLSAFSSPTSIQTPTGRHSDAFFIERSAETAITRMQKEGENMSNKIYHKKLGPKILSEYHHGEETKTVERAMRLCYFFVGPRAL
jgi:hypothetical protein